MPVRRVIRLGDKVEVQIAKVDSFKKQMDFQLATDHAARTTRPKTQTTGRKHGSTGSAHPHGKFSRRNRRR
jgi:predicted RNA-binding protein with RPS1 domain